MGKKLQPKVFDNIISALPAKERIKLRAQEISPEWLSENIAKCNALMKRDIWFGSVWFLVYSALLFVYGVTVPIIMIFLLGMVYFIYTIFKTGSFGLNKKRVQVYEQLLKAMEE